MRQAAWMIQEIERSWRMASRWVSSSMPALKYKVTFFLGDGTTNPPFFLVVGEERTFAVVLRNDYGEIFALGK
jgi:hypothetical protein